MADTKDPYEPKFEPPKPCADNLFWGTTLVMLSVVLAAFGFGATVYIVMIPSVIVFLVGFVILLMGILRVGNTIDMLGKQLLVDPDEKQV